MRGQNSSSVIWLANKTNQQGNGEQQSNKYCGYEQVKAVKSVLHVCITMSQVIRCASCKDTEDKVMGDRSRVSGVRCAAAMDM